MCTNSRRFVASRRPLPTTASGVALPEGNALTISLCRPDPRRLDNSKKPPASPESVWDEGFEFELTDIDEARRILDAESESQFDVAAIDRPQHWKKLRRVSLPTDRALTGRALDWLTTLPPNLRPQALSSQFPRIVNALAEVWDEPGPCQAAFDRLLRDGRKGRKGFPPAVREELAALRNWAQVF